MNSVHLSTKKIHSDDFFITQLISLIDSKGIKKNRLAAEVGVTPTAITNIIKGRSKPSSQMVKSISRYFGVSEEWLEYGTGQKEKQYEVTTVFIPEIKKTAEHPLKQAISGYVDKMSEEELLAEVTRLAQKFSDEQKQ